MTVTEGTRTNQAFGAVFVPDRNIRQLGQVWEHEDVMAKVIATQMLGLQSLATLAAASAAAPPHNRAAVWITRLSMQSPLEVVFTLSTAAAGVSYALLRITKATTTGLREWSDTQVYVERNKAKLEAVRLLQENLKLAKRDRESLRREFELAAEAIIDIEKFDQLQ